MLSVTRWEQSYGVNELYKFQVALKSIVIGKNFMSRGNLFQVFGANLLNILPNSVE